MRQIKCLISKSFTLLVVLLLLYKDNNVESFLFVLHHRISKQFEDKGSMYDKCAKVRNVSASVKAEEVVGAAREAITRSSRNACENFGTTDWGLNQHCMENLSR
jgi:tRNA(Ile)-lysidine synthase TilS/MesJ